ncbi:MAG: putative transporter, permease protein [Akkermansiaceae bacterium]|nr:putative transporter, permease protein [Akkermansiaceae bacterium]
MRNILTIFKREFVSYFSRPIAYAIIVVFILFAKGMTFTFGSFIASGDASLNYSFFSFHPWLFMLLAPALGMGMWADEQRNGTIELLGTFPISPWSIIFGKYLAAVSVWFITLVLTFPIVIAVNWLGHPDNGIILSGYIGSFLTCCTFLAITMFFSACTRDQVVCLIVSVLVCFVMVICGFDGFTLQVSRILGREAVESIASIGVIDHFSALTSGAFRLQDLVWFLSIIGGSLLGTSAILTAKRA